MCEESSCGFERVEGNDWRGMMALIWEDIERDYSQTEYRKNPLVVGDRGNGENPQRCTLPIQGDDV
jgi:hypothetical protein